MRMTPAVPGLLPREVQAGGLSIPALDLELPAGVTVGTCIYSIHHHADYVTDPFTFDPARWLEGHAQDKEALHSVFNPFSLGHRACLGKPLVFLELGITIARLVWAYDMRLAPEQHVEAGIAKDIAKGSRQSNEYHIQDWFLSNNFGPNAEFRARLSEDKVDSGVED
jgi:cytochrome P450